MIRRKLPTPFQRWYSQEGLPVKSCLFETTPQVVSQEIGKFCEGVVPGGTPVLVPVRPASGAELNRCHVNVADHVLAHGGEAVFGWIIWQSEVLLHAEAHCNWRSPQGELIDITPKADREGQVLFLPDPNMKWEGRMIPSRRVARITTPQVRDFILVHEQIDHLQANYRPWEGVSVLDVLRLNSLQQRLMSLAREIKKPVHSPRAPTLSLRQRRQQKKSQRRAKKKNRR